MSTIEERLDGGMDKLVDLGERLRNERERQGMSLRELARRIGVSASLISQIERDKVRPSVGTLYQIVSELGGSLDRLLFDEPEPSDNSHVAQHLADHPHVAPIQRADSRKAIRLNSGVRWERLTSASVPGIDFLYAVYEPGGESAPPDDMQRHSGREWGHVLRGELHVAIADETFVLGPGDSITFDSSLRHRLWNPGADEVHGIWFVLGR
jgi:transcriptional regulator with XRE-family HTH domain